MDKIEETYLELLRQAVRDSNPDRQNRNSQTLDQVWRLAQKQGTAALVGNELLKCNMVTNPTLLAQMKMLCMQVMVGQERQRRALEKVWRQSRRRG